MGFLSRSPASLGARELTTLFGEERDKRIRSVKELAEAYLAEYELRHKSVTFAEYALGNVTRHLGERMAVDLTERTNKEYQSRRLGEKAAPKTINEEVGLLLRLLGDRGDAIRVRLRRQKALKLRVYNRVEKAFTPEEKLPVARPGKIVAVPCGLSCLDAGTPCRNAGCRYPRTPMSRAMKRSSGVSTAARFWVL